MAIGFVFMGFQCRLMLETNHQFKKIKDEEMQRFNAEKDTMQR